MKIFYRAKKFFENDNINVIEFLAPMTEFTVKKITKSR